MINPAAWIKANPLPAAGGAAVVGLGLVHRHRAAKAGGRGASSSGASYDGGNPGTPPVSRGGVPTYDSSGQDISNALLDVDTRLAYLSDQVSALDPARQPVPAGQVSTPPPAQPQPAPPAAAKKPPARKAPQKGKPHQQPHPAPKPAPPKHHGGAPAHAPAHRTPHRRGRR